MDSPTVPNAEKTSKITSKAPFLPPANSRWLPPDCSTTRSTKQASTAIEAKTIAWPSLYRQPLAELFGERNSSSSPLKAAIRLHSQQSDRRYFHSTCRRTGSGTDRHEHDHEKQAGVGKIGKVEGIKAGRTTGNALKHRDHHLVVPKGILQAVIPFNRQEKNEAAEDQNDRSQQRYFCYECEALPNRTVSANCSRCKRQAKPESRCLQARSARQSQY